GADVRPVACGQPWLDPVEQVDDPDLMNAIPRCEFGPIMQWHGVVPPGHRRGGAPPSRIGEPMSHLFPPVYLFAEWAVGKKLGRAVHFARRRPFYRATGSNEAPRAVPARTSRRGPCTSSS